MTRPSIDWLLLGRYALLVALTALIPVPILDSWVENRLRRRLTRLIAARHGVELDDEAIVTLGDAESGGCWGFVKVVVLWPFRKVLRTVLFVFLIKAMADMISEVVHLALLLEDAIENGWIPGDALAVRGAMDRALEHVDTRIVERQILGTLRDARHELNGLIWQTTRIARQRLEGSATDALADAAEQDDLGEDVDRVTEAFAAALRNSGLVPELVQWFRAELGQVPRLELPVAGLIEPEVLEIEAQAPALALVGPDIEEAVEVSPQRDDAQASGE